jgi:hypothetical protein
MNSIHSNIIVTTANTILHNKKVEQVPVETKFGVDKKNYRLDISEKREPMSLSPLTWLSAISARLGFLF